MPLQVWVQVLAAAVLGLIYLFAGYRWIRFTTRLASALLFGAIAGWLARDLQSDWLRIALVSGAGILGYVLGNALYFLIVFLYGAAAGALLAGGAPEHTWILVAGALAGGLLALLFERPITIVASALLGGFLLAGLLDYAVSGALPREISPLSLSLTALAGWGVLSVLGGTVQAATTRPA